MTKGIFAEKIENLKEMFCEWGSYNNETGTEYFCPTLCPDPDKSENKKIQMRVCYECKKIDKIFGKEAE